MIIISRDVTDHTATPFAVADHMITNPNGSVSFVNADGSIVGQEPLQYGVRHDAPDLNSIGVYQMATRTAALVTFLTRPGDPAFTYTIVEGRAF